MMIEILKDIAKDIKENSDEDIDIDRLDKYLDDNFNPTNPESKVIKEYNSNT